MVNHARIIGVGSCLPQRVLTNSELAALVDTSDAWITERTGIKQRHIASPSDTTSSLAESAARQALAMAGVSAQAIDFIAVATTTPDRVFPSTACFLQARLGAHGCMAFDTQAVCAGFIYALTLADHAIRCGTAKRALVVGAETISRLLDWHDRSTCILFGDGAGAVVLAPSSEPGILACHLGADGRYQDLLTVLPPAPGGGGAQISPQFIHMQGNEVFRIAVQTLGRIAEQILSEYHFTCNDLDWLVPHQANTRIISATAKRLGLPMTRVILTIAEHGNTSAASVPLALDVAVRDGKIQPGQLLLLEAFGAGFTWGSVLLRW